LRYVFEAAIDAVHPTCEFACSVYLALLTPPPRDAVSSSASMALSSASIAQGTSTTRHGLLWGSTGVLVVDGRPVQFPTPSAASYSVGDTVAIAVNETSGDVAFFRNGRAIEPPSLRALMGNPGDDGVAPPAAAPQSVAQQLVLDDDGNVREVASSNNSTSPDWLRGCLNGRGPIVPAVLLHTAIGAPLSAALKRSIGGSAVGMRGDAITVAMDFNSASVLTGSMAHAPIAALNAQGYTGFENAISEIL
jgi:hypothetical protein